MQIIWLIQALKNLDQEAEFIASDNPKAAWLVVQQICGMVALLADNPSPGCPGRIAGTRELVMNKTISSLVNNTKMKGGAKRMLP